jgi:hypothetical protein
VSANMGFTTALSLLSVLSGAAFFSSASLETTEPYVLYPQLARSALRPAECANTSHLDKIQYTISPNFVWFPSDVTPSDLLSQIKTANPNLFKAPNANNNGPGPSGGKRPLTGNLPSLPSPFSSSSPSTTIRATIPRFLNSPCTFTLTVHSSAIAPAEATMQILNETLGSSDLLCRLALHKTGDVRTEYAHTLLSMHLKGTIQPSSKRTLVSSEGADGGISNNYHMMTEEGFTTEEPLEKRAPQQGGGKGSGTAQTPDARPSQTVPANGSDPPPSQDSAPPELPNGGPPKSPGRYTSLGDPTSTEQHANRLAPRQAKGPRPNAAETPGFEYTITCPASLGKNKDGPDAAAVIEGLKKNELALVRDCEWCKKAVKELQSVCRIPVPAGAVEVANPAGWTFGGAVCSGCDNGKTTTSS